MIKLKDSLKLASIKFRTRKLRNFFSGCSLAIGVVTVIVFFLATSGLQGILNTAFRDSLDSKFLSSEQFQFSIIDFEGNQTVVSEREQTDQEYKNKRSGFDFKNLYRSRYSYSYAELVGISKPQTDSGPLASEETLSLITLEKLFINDYIDPKFANDFEKENENVVPVIVPKSFILNREMPVNSNLSIKDQYEKSKSILNTYLGFETKVKIKNLVSEETKEFNIKIIGYHLGASLFDIGFSLGQSIVFPNWFYNNNEDFRSFFENGSYSIIPEFVNKAERDRFNSAYAETFFTRPETIDETTGFVIPISGRFAAFEETINFIRNFVFGIGIFFLIIAGIFILTTVGKIVSDSKKEIGVFRAIGAQRFDIAKIFFSYTFLLTTAGFLMGLVLAFFINTIVSLLYGDNLFYQIGTYATSSGLQKPLFLFIGLPILELLALYFFILVIGFLAAIIPITFASRVDPIVALREE